eukprot:GHVN01081595.1.p1 GENE.GHVN01081595.1~~GHVN01081595.1.p1  ORF type:complete len:728 (+),score=110.99 GHVN01081595.1:300-2186(+)
MYQPAVVALQQRYAEAGFAYSQFSHEEKPSRRGVATTPRSAYGYCDLTLWPTDPDFDLTYIPEGLQIRIGVPLVEPVKQIQSAKSDHPNWSPQSDKHGVPYLIVLSDDVSDFMTDILPKLFDEAIRKSLPVLENKSDKPAPAPTSESESRSAQPAQAKPSNLCSPEFQSSLAQSSLLINGVKYIDRHLADAFKLSQRIAATGMDTSSDKGTGEDSKGMEKIEERGEKPEAPTEAEKLQKWTKEEQIRLEDALVWYGKYKEPVTKWKMIGKFVKTRTARECLERYKELHAKVVEASRKTLDEAQLDSSSDEWSESCEGESDKDDEIQDEDGDSPTQLQQSSASSLGGVPIRLLQLSLDGLDSIKYATTTFQVHCWRCKRSADIPLSFGAHGSKELKSAGAGGQCENCKLRFTINVEPRIAHAHENIIGMIKAVECLVKDVIGSDYVGQCTNCSGDIRMRNILQGFPRTSNCNSCHSSVCIRYSGVQFGLTMAKGAKGETALKGKDKEHDKMMGIKLGTPLPKNGACKHYKKSYRWMRFPCCGKAFPCDVCHDENTDHDNVWATRMICGHCSKEQAFSPHPCASCGAAMVAGKSTHWEGGKGCRDPSKMARNDSRKHKLASKMKQKASKK